MSSVSNRLTRALTLICVLALPSLATAGSVTTSRTIGFAKGTAVRSAITDQCELQTVIPAAVAASAPEVQLIDGRGTLRMEITGVHGPGGGVFSGPKWVQVSGRLKKGGKTYTFRAKRFSATDPFGGTCTILQKCGRALAGDIATWLANPVGKAVLGDAK